MQGENLFSFDRIERPVLSVSQRNAQNIPIHDESILAEVNISLNSDQIRFVVHEPVMLDWVAFLGGIAMIVFLLGKMFNECCFGKKYISPMMDQLFEI